MSDEIVLEEIDDGVAIVTMNRPEARNALSRALTRRLIERIAALDARDDVRAIVLTGADPAFCAGVDLKELASSPSGREAAPLGDQNGPFAPRRKPLVGAVNGPAVTGGLEIALACDFLIASDRARFADTHARVGVMPGWGLSLLLAEAVGSRRARQMSFTGDYIDAATALDWGLVNEVVAPADLMPRARQIATAVAGIDTEPIQEIKELYDLVRDEQFGDGWAIERRRSNEWLASRFDNETLAASRASIQARGKQQL